MKHNICYGCMEHSDGTDLCPRCGFNLKTYSTAPHQLPAGTMLQNRYAVGKVLGEGGFGITYIGLDTVLDRKVAVKEFYMSGYVNRNTTISSTVFANTGAYGETFEKNREKFLGEARVLARFDNEEGIVGIRDFFKENNTAYIVMDFLEGETLRDYIERKGKLSAEDAFGILRPVFNSLNNVHSHNIIHRDISPDNIMLTANGKVKLLDFGAARDVSAGDMKSLSIILKPGYAPEEQYRSKGKQGPWTDVYALCATVYRCVTGVVPEESMNRLFEDRLSSPAELGAHCSLPLSDVIMKGLAVRCTDRYQSVAELMKAVDSALRCGGKIQAKTAPVPTPVDEDRTVFANPRTQADEDKTVYANPRTQVDENRTVFANPKTQADEDRTVFANPKTQADEDKTVYANPRTTVDKNRTAPAPKSAAPAAPPAKQTPKKRKKGIGLIIGLSSAATAILLFIVLVVGVIFATGSDRTIKNRWLEWAFASSSGRLEGEEFENIPAPFSDEITINGISYSLPATVGDFFQNGWTVGKYETSGNLKYVNCHNGKGSIRLVVTDDFNKDDVSTWSSATVLGVEISQESFNSEKGGKSNTFKYANLKFGYRFTKFANKYPEGYALNEGFYTIGEFTSVCKYNLQSDSITLIFINGKLETIRIIFGT